MRINRKINCLGILLLILLFNACRLPSNLHERAENRKIPGSYKSNQDTVNTATVKWRNFFTDQYLIALIDTALKNNQQLNVILQEINVANNEVRARKGAYLPFLDVNGGAGVEKVGRYTSQGASDAANDISPGKKVPEVLPNYVLTATVSWEADIWKKLRNSRKSAVYRYLSSVEGKNFMVTNLIAEIATCYYQLIALDNQLEILRKTIEIYKNSLEIVRLEKQSARVTELAVRRFEAEVLKNQSRQFYIMQNITETENRINFLVGRFPQPLSRNSQGFVDLVPDTVYAGIPSQLFDNRPDIRQAEQELAAAKLDIKIARANFYPSLIINAGAGINAFNPTLLIRTPQSLLYWLAGDLIAPVVNRNAIKAAYYSATSRQIQAAYNYERTVLNAFIEVANQVSNVNNLRQSYDLKAKQVLALNQSIDISSNLFKNARADYMEVLLTQRDALESKFELIETKMQQMHARVNIYQALGGGWN